MSTGSRRSTRTRQPREMKLASGTTYLWLAMVVFAVGSWRLSGRIDLTYVIAFGLVAALVWAWVFVRIRARTAVGKTLEEIQSLDPDQFEEWVAARFRDLDYSVRLTGTSGDHGIDLILGKQDEVAIVQCKNYRMRSVGEPVLRDLFGAMHDFGATRAYLVTSGQLTVAAAEWAKGKPIEVWNGAYITRLASKAIWSKPGIPEPSECSEARSAVPEDLGPMPTARVRAVCPRCGSTLVERHNRQTNQAFLGCSKYPNCRHTQPLGALPLASNEVARQ